MLGRRRLSNTDTLFLAQSEYLLRYSERKGEGKREGEGMREYWQKKMKTWQNMRGKI